MSQYPNPYQPQHPAAYYPTGGYTDPQAPAKRASILMFVLGGILSLSGLCCMGLGPLVKQAQFTPEQQAEVNRFEEETGMPFAKLFTTLGVANVVPGILLLISGFFVRRGRMGAVIAGIILVSVLVIACLLLLIGSILSVAMGDPSAILGIGVMLVALALLGLLLFWLIQAAKNSSMVNAMQAQYQMQYWQYQQQHQAYHQPPQPPQSAAQQPPPPPQQKWPPPPSEP